MKATKMTQNKNSEELSNIRVAMDKVAETLEPSIPMSVTEDGGPADKQVLIRTTEAERQKWKDASVKENETLSSWIRKHLNEKAEKTLTCQHERVKNYPWATICLQCRQRL
jgi:hypothetical protein